MRVIYGLSAISLLALSMVGCNSETSDMSGTSLMPGVTTSVVASDPETTTSSPLPLGVSLIQVFGGSMSEHGSLAMEDGMRPEHIEWSSMTAVAVGGPGLVAGGVSHSAEALTVDAAVWVSPDGRSWTRIDDESGVFGDAMSSTDEPVDQAITDMAGGSLGVIAVGTDGLPSGQDGAIWVSDNGLTWERVLLDQDVFGGEGDQTMHAVVQVSGQVVVVGESGGYASAWVSSDRVHWNRAEVNDESIEAGVEPSVMNDVAVTPFGLVAVGSSGLDMGPAVWLSENGVSWDRLLDSMAGQQSGFSTSDSMMSPMIAVAACDQGLVAIGTKGRPDEDPSYADWTTEGPLVWTSVDGFDWQLLDSNFLEVAGDKETSGFAYMKRGAPVLLEDVAWIGDRMTAIGGYELLPSANALPRFVTLWISIDGGSTWHPAAETPLPPTESWRGARAFTQFGGSVVLVGNDDIPAGRHPEYGWPTWADTAAVWIANAAAAPGNG